MLHGLTTKRSTPDLTRANKTNKNKNKNKKKIKLKLTKNKNDDDDRSGENNCSRA